MVIKLNLLLVYDLHTLQVNPIDQIIFTSIILITLIFNYLF